VDAPAPAAEQPQADQEMPTGEFESWLEGLRNQETQQGLDDLHTAAWEKLMNSAQRLQFEETYRKAKVELEPKPAAKAKKKAA
jgi:hypothetical protein